jgi:hypothetical protein
MVGESHPVQAVQMKPLSANAASGKLAILINFGLFQLGWFSCIVGAAHGLAWAGSCAVLLIVILHLFSAEQPMEAFKLVLLAVLIGAVWDSAMVMTGWIRFHDGNFIQGVAPHWILALWALFATTLNVSLVWMRNRHLITVLLGAIGGPLSYWGGARIGAITFVEPLPALIALAVGWALLMLLLMAAAQRFNGFVAIPPHPQDEEHAHV